MKAKAPLWLLAIVSVLTACQQEYGIPACARTADMPPALKMEHYRSPTPACVPNAETLDTTGLQKLIAAEKPVLVDVYALQRSVNEGFGSVWLPNKAHESLPGAIWLPNVGYGTIEADIEAYFQRELQRLTADDKNYPLVFYCVADCWMSWNAVQRAHDYGYKRVYWYRTGVDGWKEAGLPIITLEPQPVASD